MMWWGDDYMPGWWLMGGFAVLCTLLIVTIAAVLIYAITGSRRDSVGQEVQPRASEQVAPRTAALAILQERYARGDISTDDYLDRVEHLSA